MGTITISSRGRHRPQPGTLGVNVSRASRWGNPFVVGVDGTLEECVARYRAMPELPGLVRELREHIEKRRRRERLPVDCPVVLICGAAHAPCHCEPLRDGLLARDGNETVTATAAAGRSPAISYDQLLRAGACRAGISFYRQQWGKGPAPLTAVAAALTTHPNGVTWGQWLLSRDPPLVPAPVAASYQQAVEPARTVYEKSWAAYEQNQDDQGLWQGTQTAADDWRKAVRSWLADYAADRWQRVLPGAELWLDLM